MDIVSDVHPSRERGGWRTPWAEPRVGKPRAGKAGPACSLRRRGAGQGPGWVSSVLWRERKADPPEHCREPSAVCLFKSTQNSNCETFSI